MNDSNLCDLYTELGADALCDTCKNYPRHMEEFEGIREFSLSLSCPVAAQMILNREAPMEFYEEEDDVAECEEDYEEVDFKQPKGESLIMQCRHCIRYSLGYCVKRGGKKPQWKEPLFLELGDGRRFRLEFNCAQCQMDVYSAK